LSFTCAQSEYFCKLNQNVKTNFETGLLPGQAHTASTVQTQNFAFRKCFSESERRDWVGQPVYAAPAGIFPVQPTDRPETTSSQLLYTRSMKVIGPYVMSAVPQVGGLQVSAPHAGHELPATVVSSRPRTPQRRKTDAPALVAESNAATGSAPAGNDGATTSPVPGSPVSGHPVPMHGLDRLTGMPVLLHRLSEFVVPLPLPDSPYLLPVGEVDVWDAQPYAVTELPLSASPVTDPLLAARGALHALADLHRAGLVHGGLNASQLWQVGRGVQLAGAGLPWDQSATPASDMQALGQALDALGPRPAALKDLERLTAEQALERLYPVAERVSPAPEGHADVWPAASEAETSAPISSAAPVEAVTPTAPFLPAVQAPGSDDAEVVPAELRLEEAQEVVLAPESSTSIIEDLEIRAAPMTETLEQSAVTAPSTPSTASTPYRSGADIIVIGELGAAEGRAETGEMLVSDVPAGQTIPRPAVSVSESSQPPNHLIPAPIRIGFDDLPALPGDWSPDEAAPPTFAEEQRMKGEAALDDFAHGGPSVAEPRPAAAPAELRSTAPEAAEPEQAEEPPAAVASDSRQTGRVARTVIGGVQAGGAPRGQPLRIGWEEDHSWRVVKSGPERPSGLVRRLPLWLPVLLLVLALGGGALWLAGRSASPAAACCTQTFTVSGSRLPVKVTLVQGPPGSSLLPGAVIGTVSGSGPATLKFPNAAGRYTLRFSAQGHGTLSGAVTVPSTQPFKIVLK
jgi:hypothetical protein